MLLSNPMEMCKRVILQVIIVIIICIISIFFWAKMAFRITVFLFRQVNLRDRSCKMNILSLFINPHVVPRLIVKFSFVQQESVWMMWGWINDDWFAIFRWTNPLSRPWWCHTYPKMDYTEVYNFSVSAIMCK